MGVEESDLIGENVDRYSHTCKNNSVATQNVFITTVESTEIINDTPEELFSDASNTAPATINQYESISLNPTNIKTDSKDGGEFLQDENINKSEILRYFDLLTEGKDIHGDSGIPMDSPPDWFDITKFKRGQLFAMHHVFGLMYAEMLSLFLLFSFPNSLAPLIFTEKSDTPFKAFKRYLSTVFRIKSWYEGDFWSTDSSARKNLKYVRAIHAKVRQDMSSCPYDKRKVKSTLTSCTKSIWSYKAEEYSEDFSSSSNYCCPFTININSFSVDRNFFLSQTEMAVTQFGFVGLMILYPDRFGAPDATEEDLDSFLHVWRTIGYCLGIQDEYNFCNGTLEEVKERSRALIRFGFIPSMAKLTADWEHMSRCMVEGISYYVQGTTFEVSLYYLTQVLGINAPRIYEAMTALQRFLYRCTWFILTVLLRFYWARIFFNWMILGSLKRAQNGSNEWLESLRNRQYAYQNGPQICLNL